MTVAELIVKLQALPDQGMRVIVNGYEGGYHDVGPLKETSIILDRNDAWYYGPHEDARDYKNEVADEVAILISRGG